MGLTQIGAPLAWSIATGSPRIAITVVDQGIDYTHPDLYLYIWLNQEEIPAAIREALVDVDGDGLITFWDLNAAINQGPGKIVDLNGNGVIDGGDVLRPTTQGGWADGVDNGGNGFVDDLLGWDFWDDDNDPMEISLHGTPIAGIIGAIGDNGVGITGINWKCSLMVTRVHDGVASTTPAHFLRLFHAVLGAVAYGIDNGARVMSVSGGAPVTIVPPEIAAAFSALLDEASARGIVYVGSAGNDGLNTDIFRRIPGSFTHDNLIIVAATFRQHDRLAFFGGQSWVPADPVAPLEGLCVTGARLNLYRALLNMPQ